MKQLIAAISLSALFLSFSPIYANAEPASNISFIQIEDNMNIMTEVAFSEYVESIKGKTVIWKGQVDDVSKGLFVKKGHYEVYVRLIPTSGHVIIDIPIEQAKALKKGQKIKFSAKIRSVRNMLGCRVGVTEAKLLK